MPKEYIEMEAVIEKNHGGVVYIDDIKNIPAADVDPVRHGRWVESNNFDIGFWVCSNCNFVSEAIAAHKLYKYCPNCGCKMDLEG